MKQPDTDVSSCLVFSFFIVVARSLLSTGTPDGSRKGGTGKDGPENQSKLRLPSSLFFLR